jgi:hypothetical protein
MVLILLVSLGFETESMIRNSRQAERMGITPGWMNFVEGGR